MGEPARVADGAQRGVQSVVAREAGALGGRGGRVLLLQIAGDQGGIARLRMARRKARTSRGDVVPTRIAWPLDAYLAILCIAAIYLKLLIHQRCHLGCEDRRQNGHT